MPRIGHMWGVIHNILKTLARPTGLEPHVFAVKGRQQSFAIVRSSRPLAERDLVDMSAVLLKAKRFRNRARPNQ